MTTIEKHFLHRLKGSFAFRNSTSQESRIYNRHECKRLIPAIRAERDGANSRYLEHCSQRATGLIA